MLNLSAAAQRFVQHYLYSGGKCDGILYVLVLVPKVYC